MKNRKKLSLFLVLAMLLTMLGGLGVTVSAEEPVTADTTWWTKVSSAEELRMRISGVDQDGIAHTSNENGTSRNHWGPAGTYYLTNDITVTEPLADEFTGCLGGDPENPPTITLQIAEGTASAPISGGNVGLFRQLKGDKVQIQNLILDGEMTVVSSGGTNVGALAGKANGLAFTAIDSTSRAVLSNCMNHVDITVTGGDSVGGFIGYFYDNSSSLKISKLVNKGTITADGQTGGIVGIAGNKLKFFECENYGNVTGKNNVGGITGRSDMATNEWHNGSIQKCYNAGAINGTSDVGGIVGYSHLPLPITDCVNAGTVKGSYTGSLYGTARADNPVTYTNCFYLDEQGTTTGSEGITPKTLAELKAMTDLPADFTAALNKIVILPGEYAGYTPIQSAEDFQKITSTGKYYLANDIVLNDYTPLETFSGTLVGSASAKPTIEMHINETADKAVNVGLFRTLGADAKIENIRLDGTITVTNSATGNENPTKVGALAGKIGGNWGATVNNCVNAATIDVTTNSVWGDYIGGFVGGLDNGYSSNVKFTNAVNEGKITAKKWDGTRGSVVGGIVGMTGVAYGLFSGCENYGAVSGGTVGGIAGMLYMQGDTAGDKITGCYNAGTLNGNTAGGIIGNVAGASRTIRNCVNAGTINGAYPNTQTIYGVVNVNTIEVTLDNCSYLSKAAETGAKTLEEMKALTGPAAFKAALEKLVVYTVTVADATDGTLTPAGSFYADSGSEFSVTAEPAEGYRIASVKANGVALTGNAENVYTTTINGDVTITAEFEQAAVVPTIVSPTGGAFTLTDGCGSITFGTVSGIGYEIKDYGICYSKTSQEPTEKLSAKAKALVNGQFGVKLLFVPALETGATYYTRPYVTYANADGEESTVYGAMVTTTIE